MRVKAVLFDLDQTLTDQDSAFVMARAAVARYASSKRHIDPIRLVQAVEDIEHLICDQHPTRPLTKALGIGGRDLLWGDTSATRPEFQPVASWVPEFRFAVWSAALADQGVSDADLAQELAARFPDEMRARINRYPDAFPAVRQLAESYKLAVVTNGLPASQRFKLSRAGLNELVGTVVSSGDLGIAKPSPLLFITALERLGASAAEAVEVGDNLELDVQGARNAGIRGVWLNRDRTNGNDGLVAPNAQIASLAELPGLLARFQ